MIGPVFKPMGSLGSTEEWVVGPFGCFGLYYSTLNPGTKGSLGSIGFFFVMGLYGALLRTGDHIFERYPYGTRRTA